LSKKKEIDENVKTIIRRFFLLSIFLLSILLAIHTGLNVMRGGDTWWYLSSGRYIVENSAVPQTDNFSYTFKNKSWVNPEWLTNVIFYLLYSKLGENSLAYFKIIIVLLLFSIIGIRIYFKTGDYYLSLLGIIIISYFGRIYLDIRAQIITFLLISICLLCMDFYEKGKKWPLYLIPLLIIPWVNLHGGFMYLFIILGSLWIFELVKILNIKKKKPSKKKKSGQTPKKNIDDKEGKAHEKKTLLVFSLLILASFLLSLINPFGFNVYECNFKFITEPAYKNTLEWLSPFNSNFSELMTPLYWVYCIFFLIFSFFNFKKLSKPGLIISFISMFLSFSSRRFIPLFVFISIPEILFSLSLMLKSKIQDLALEKITYQISIKNRV